MVFVVSCRISWGKTYEKSIRKGNGGKPNKFFRDFSRAHLHINDMKRHNLYILIPVRFLLFVVCTFSLFFELVSFIRVGSIQSSTWLLNIVVLFSVVVAHLSLFGTNINNVSHKLSML